MFGPSSCDASADGYFRAFAKNCTFCTSPFIDVPKVRPNEPSAPKNADITFSRSARLGSARSSPKAA